MLVGKGKKKIMVTVLSREKFSKLGRYTEKHTDGSVYETSCLKLCKLKLPKKSADSYDCYVQSVCRKKSLTDIGIHEENYYAVRKRK